MRYRVGALSLAGAVFLSVTSALAFSMEPFQGLGDKPPMPEVMDAGPGGLIKLRIVREKDGALAYRVDQSEVLVLEAYFSADITKPDQNLNLECWIYYRDPQGGAKELRRKFPCYRGRVSDGNGHWQKLNVDYRFMPEETDQNGTSGIALLFAPANPTYEGIIATYDWRGGIEPEVQQ